MDCSGWGYVAFFALGGFLALVAIVTSHLTIVWLEGRRWRDY